MCRWRQPSSSSEKAEDGDKDDISVWQLWLHFHFHVFLFNPKDNIQIEFERASTQGKLVVLVSSVYHFTYPSLDLHLEWIKILIWILVKAVLSLKLLKWQWPAKSRSQTSAPNVSIHPLRQAIWGNTWKHTMEKSKKMQSVWLCIFSRRHFEKTFENAQWRKVKQMQPV